MNAFLLASAGTLGLLIGSFLNVVAYRVPAGLSIVSPGSACPGCGNAISARDNVPLLSWLLLKGRCRRCDMRIPARYPIVEGATGVAFVVAALPFVVLVTTSTDPRAVIPGALELVAFLYLAAISVVLAVIDLDVWRLPDRIVLPAYAVGAALLGAVGLIRGDVVALGLAAAGSGAAVLFYLILHGLGGMALGDVKLAGVLGLFLGFLGPEQLVIGIAGGFFVGGVIGVAMIAARKAGRKSAMPFGPWMLAGAWIGVLAGQPIADGYLHVTGLA